MQTRRISTLEKIFDSFEKIVSLNKVYDYFFFLRDLEEMYVYRKSSAKRERHDENVFLKADRALSKLNFLFHVN